MKKHLQLDSYGLGHHAISGGGGHAVESWCYEVNGGIEIVVAVDRMGVHIGTATLTLPVRKLRGYLARKDKPDGKRIQRKPAKGKP